MKIPKEIEIAGNRIKIKWKKNMKNCGMAHFMKNEIWPNWELRKNDDLVGVTLAHELNHIILYILNEDKLNEQEKLIDQISHLQWQIIKQLMNR